MSVLSIGQLLDRRYRIIEILMATTGGQTYLAADLRRPGYPQCIVRQFRFPSSNPKALQVVQLLFKKKAETLEKLGNHDRIPQLLACFEQDGLVFFVEEYIAGQALDRELSTGQPLSEEYVVRLLFDLLEVLDFVHRNGVIHRNLRPDTIIRRTVDSRLVPIEFGLIQEIANPSVRADRLPPVSTTTPEVLAYIPPEQIQGNPLYNSDLFAVGTICVRALTGWTAADILRSRTVHLPAAQPAVSSPGAIDVGEELLEAAEATIADRSVADTALQNWRTISRVSPELSEFIDRLIQPAFDRRYSSAEEALRDLKALYGSQAGISGAGLSGAGLSGANRLLANAKAAKANSAGSIASPFRWWRSKRVLGFGLVGLVGLGAVIWVSGPLRTGYWLGQGSENRKGANPKEAISAFDRALELDANNPDALLGRGSAYADAGQYQKAIVDLDQAVRLKPDRATGYFQRGTVRYYLGDVAGALDDYDRAIKLDPNLGSAYLNRGNVKAAQSDDRGAIADYDKAIGLNQGGPSTIAKAYLNRGLSKSNLGDQKGAIEDATQAIQLNPSYAFAYQNRGLAYRRIDDLKRALDDFNVAIQLAPDDPDPYYNRGLTRYDLGDTQGTIEDFNKAIELQPNHALTYYDRGVVRANQGDRPGAIADFQQSAKLCLDVGRVDCYRDAQGQIQLLQAPNPNQPSPALKFSEAAGLDQEPSSPSPNASSSPGSNISPTPAQKSTPTTTPKP